MSPERTSGILIPILVLLAVHHGLALQCYVCSSLENPSCSSNPKDIVVETCGFSTMSSTANAITADWSSTTQTSVSPASSTEAEGTSSTTQTSVSPASSTEAGGSSSSQSTKFTTENSSSISTQSASASTGSEVTTDTSDHSETFSSTITESSSSSGTENNSTENTGTAFVSTTDNASTESDSSSTDGSSSPSTPDKLFPKSDLDIPLLHNLVRRDIPGTIGPRKSADHVCYKIVYTKNQRSVTERGCYAGTSSASCSALKENIGPQSWTTCTTCVEDGCNSTSTIQLSLTTLFLLLATIFVLVR